MPHKPSKHEIILAPCEKNRDRIDYMFKLLDTDEKRLELVDTHRNKNLAHAFVTFAAAYGASLKFFADANPILISVSLFLLAVAFFLRDMRSHQYSHGWTLTIKKHLYTLSEVINAPQKPVNFKRYYKEGHKLAIRWKEWFSPTRLAYYVLFIGAFLSYFILKEGWIQKLSGKN